MEKIQQIREKLESIHRLWFKNYNADAPFDLERAYNDMGQFNEEALSLIDEMKIKYEKEVKKMITVKVEDIIQGKVQSPLPLEVIPNYMGINLCSVDSITWDKQADGQLVSLTINFLPTKVL